MDHEFSGWVTSWVPTNPYQGLDSKCCFYNRDTPDIPSAQVCVFRANTRLLP